MTSLRVTLQIPSLLPAVGVATAALRAMSERLCASEEDSSALEICLTEALNNVIEHAYLGQPGHPITVELSGHDDAVQVTVIDAGLSMPQGRVERAHLPWVDPSRVQHLPEGGFGLGLIQSLAREVHYQRSEGANTLSFTRALTAGPPPLAALVK